MAVNRECPNYEEVHDMGSTIPCCRRHYGLGNCPCDACDDNPYRINRDVSKEAKDFAKNIHRSQEIFIFDTWLGMLQREGHKRISEGKGWLCDFKWIETEDDKG